MRLMPLGAVTFVIGLAPVNFAGVEMPSRLIDRAVDQILDCPVLAEELRCVWLCICSGAMKKTCADLLRPFRI